IPLLKTTLPSILKAIKNKSVSIDGGSNIPAGRYRYSVAVGSHDQRVSVKKQCFISSYANRCSAPVLHYFNRTLSYDRDIEAHVLFRFSNLYYNKSTTIRQPPRSADYLVGSFHRFHRDDGPVFDGYRLSNVQPRNFIGHSHA